MLMMIPRRLQFLTLVLVTTTGYTWAQTQQEQQQSSSSSSGGASGGGTQCPLCVGGEEPNLTKTIGGAADGPSCASLVNDVQVDTEGCLELQILGYRWCDCPSYPTDDFCTMCDNAFHEIPNRFKEIPGTNGKVTCDQLLFVPKTAETRGAGEEGAVCAEAMKPGYICGCPNAEEPNCAICGGTTEDDTKMTNPDAVVAIEGMGEVTCQELVDRAVLGTLSVEQCGLVHHNTADVFLTCGCPINGDEPGLGREETIPSNNATSSEADDSDTTTASSSSDVPIETDSTITEEGDDNNSGASSRFAALMVVLLVGSSMMA